MSTTSALDEILEFHWMMDMLQTVDVGIVVLNSDFEIKVWNGFMEAHSGKLPSDVRDKTLFSLFPDISETWFRRKAKAVFELRTRAFMTWEQRPYLFKFRNFRPITGTEPFMYQNISISALVSATGQVDHVCMMIYDMTDAASAKKQLLALQVEHSEMKQAAK
ncbi:PAS domain-containing protein [Brumicola nitratireducens]|uniref:Sensory box/GGDEF protein n=1 Tax=Glaciecola nitratireducens (strain JCM 12485 / KCTC 12276 / FR1064) TaxID=1085623 RepID=G4QG19_GLANF|nr:PAS domain-containing protein [Glaciecola nitratireducens]AEP29110.1 sensory box/GGDEF protein [Glaciecola nitratireducens FR1064]|tara:strand:- start:155 stop:643 length:489 start_codon:yes stop_codon:yes gene_type:complete